MKRELLGRTYSHWLYKDTLFNANKNLVLGVTLTHDIFQVSLIDYFFHYKNNPILQDSLQIKENANKKYIYIYIFLTKKVRLHGVNKNGDKD